MRLVATSGPSQSAGLSMPGDQGKADTLYRYHDLEQHDAHDR